MEVKEQHLSKLYLVAAQGKNLAVIRQYLGQLLQRLVCSIGYEHVLWSKILQEQEQEERQGPREGYCLCFYFRWTHFFLTFFKMQVSPVSGF